MWHFWVGLDIVLWFEFEVLRIIRNINLSRVSGCRDKFIKAQGRNMVSGKCSSNLRLLCKWGTPLAPVVANGTVTSFMIKAEDVGVWSVGCWGSGMYGELLPSPQHTILIHELMH
jgi:hypothetical protein